MRWPRIFFLLIILSILGLFLHYTLPQRDIVRIVGVESRLTEVEGFNAWFFAARDSGTTQTSALRDLRLISTITPGGRPVVFRNEDTGILWPPYFKFDSEDLQTEALNLRSTEAEPRWVAVTHYGWRSNFLSIYPNALEIAPVEGPDVRLIPWMPIAVLLVLAALLFIIWRMWERFEDRVIVPAADAGRVRWAKLRDRFGGR